VVVEISGRAMSLPAAVTEETRAIRPCHKFQGHTGVVAGVIHMPGGHRMTTSSSDGSLRAWDLQSGKQIGNDWRDGGGAVYVIGLSPDGKKVASGSGDGAVRLWDVDTGKVIAKWVGHTRNAFSVCWSRDGGRVVSGALDDGTARVWDVESGKTVLAIETGLESVWAVIYSPDTTMIATGGSSNAVIGIAISPNGQILASASKDKTARLWNFETGQPIGSPLQHENWVMCTSFAPDGKLLASGCDDKNAYMWDVSAIVKEAGLAELLLNPNVS
jgi:hypothetical protein